MKIGEKERGQRERRGEMMKRGGGDKEEGRSQKVDRRKGGGHKPRERRKGVRQRQCRGEEREREKKRSEAERQQVGKMPRSFMAQRRICNTFITLLPRKAAARPGEGCRLEAREREGEREGERQKYRLMGTKGTLNALTQTIHSQHRERRAPVPR